MVGRGGFSVVVVNRDERFLDTWSSTPPPPPSVLVFVSSSPAEDDLDDEGEKKVDESVVLPFVRVDKACGCRGH